MRRALMALTVLALGGMSAAPIVPSAPDESEFTPLAVEFIGAWEGLRLTAYQDIVGVWTVCYGETKSVKRGDTYSKPQCDAMFAREIGEYRSGLGAYLTAQTKAQRLPAAREVAFVSLAYNVGVRGAGKSTAVKRLNAGRVSAACDALTWWNKAGSRVIRGLVRRRASEYNLCMQGSV